MVLVEGRANPRATWEFLSEIWLLENEKAETCINYSYLPMINTQTAR